MRTRRALTSCLSVASLAGLLAVAPASTASAVPAPTVVGAGADVATDQVIVRFRSTGTRLDTVGLQKAAGQRLRAVRPLTSGTYVVKLSRVQRGAVLSRTMTRMARAAGIASIEPDVRMFAQASATDPMFTSQWDLGAPVAGKYGMNATGAWDITTGSAGITVAVVDTGYLDHADLAGRFVPGYDFISDALMANDGNGRDADAHDPGDWVSSVENQSGYFAGCGVSTSSWHGTHVNGTIGASTNNGVGIAGINRVSKILPVRALGKCGGYSSDIIDGMRWAAGLPVVGVPNNPNKARVINLSLGGAGTCGTTWQTAINAITAAGTVVVVAAGNSGASASLYSPASCAGVVTVAATGKAGNRAYYSNSGSAVEVAAPGGDSSADLGDTILSTLNSGSTSPGADAYARYQGTSMAAPHVAGVVSLMLSVNPALTPAQVTAVLQSSATPFPAGSTCLGTCGTGIVNAGAAVVAAGGTPPPTTTTTTTTTIAPPPSSTTTTLPPATTTTRPPSSTTTTTVPTGALPGSFGKSSPLNGATSFSRTVSFAWSSSARATGYEICVDTVNDNACNTSWISTGAARSIRISFGTRAVRYWQVRAVNAAGRTLANGGLWWKVTVR